MALHIAPRGWEHAGWSGAFYPDDLPAEWRLTYFANHFDALVVPAARWRAADPAERGRWCDEGGARLRLFLETDAVDGAAQEAARLLGENFGGFATPEGRVARWNGGAADLRALRGVVEALAAPGGDALLIIDGDPPSLEALHAARIIAQLLGSS